MRDGGRGEVGGGGVVKVEIVLDVSSGNECNGRWVTFIEMLKRVQRQNFVKAGTEREWGAKALGTRQWESRPTDII
jgi:hypothetical protein